MNPYEYIEKTMKMVENAVRNSVKEIELVDTKEDKANDFLHDASDGNGNYILGDCIYDKDGNYVDEVAPEMNQAEKDVEIEAMKKAE